jgi:hypothetical protein
MQHGFEERSITQFARGPSLGMFGHLQHGLKLLPDGFADDFAHGMFEHPKLQSLLRTFVHFIIREHSLEHLPNFSPDDAVHNGIEPSGQVRENALIGPL